MNSNREDLEKQHLVNDEVNQYMSVSSTFCNSSTEDSSNARILELRNSSCSGGRILNEKLSLSLGLNSCLGISDPNPTSPDSDGDVLGVLDQIPDIPDEQAKQGQNFLPFITTFDCLTFSELMPNVFIPGQPIVLQVLDMEVLPSTLNLFNQCVFVISVEHGSTSWILRRKSRQILSLHSQLKLFTTRLNIPSTSSEKRERKQSMKALMKEGSWTEGGCIVNSKRLVKFPRKALQRMDNFTLGEVELYLNNLLHHPLFKTHSAVLEFLEISPISFVTALGLKLDEGFVRKMQSGKKALILCGGQYKRRWLVLRESCLFLISPNVGTIRTVMLIDSGFQVSYGFRHTRVSKGLFITNLSRSLVLKCDSEKSEREWAEALEKIKNEQAVDFSRKNRHLSFSPVRKNANARWYVDGAWYMSDVADMLEEAREEIYITDWWLSPDIYLKRPDLTGSSWKLNEVLKRAAERGVKVFILLYKEVELALGINSLYSKQSLCRISGNIKVLRHPDHLKSSLYWAHHEKMVIIDQNFAFVGGIDLCYGRWDDYRHKLVDVGHAGVKTEKAYMSAIGKLISNTSPGGLFTGSSNLPSEDTVKESDSKLLNNFAEPVSQIDGCIEVPTLYCESVETEETACKNNVLDEKNIVDLSAKEKSNDISSSNEGQGVVIDVKAVENLEHKYFFDAMDSQKLENGSEETSCKEGDIIESDVSKKQEGNNLTVMSSSGNAEMYTLNLPSTTVNPNEDPVSPTSGSSTEMHSTFSDFSDQDSSCEESDDVYTIPKSVGVVFREDEELKCSQVSEDCQKGLKGRSQSIQGKISQNVKTVKNLGLDLMQDMKDKKSKLQSNIPKFKRTAIVDSELEEFSSDIDSDAPTQQLPKKSNLRQKLKRRNRSRTPNCLRIPLAARRASSTGSLIDLHNALTHSEATSSSVHLWVGKDYVNWITKDLSDPHMPFNDVVNRHRTPRMPWHDVALYIEGPAARDAARHFIQRWNAIKSEKVKNNENYPYLIPKSYYSSFFSPSVLSLMHRVKCQVVRSVGSWNCGLNKTERSIYNSYLEAIKNSKHYIYIENQFFISSASLGGSEVSNLVAYYIHERIFRAHRNCEKFRVYIMLPLLPAFEGQIGTPSGVSMQYILHYTFKSIISGPHSLIGRLAQANIDWKQYISFCSLRTHDVLEGVLVTELIYIHSKLLIVDDRLVIAGSANINDRSLLGNRDSEVDLHIEDEEFSRGKMDGKPCKMGKFAGSLRMYLFGEHLGSPSNQLIDITDPICDKFFDSWNEIAHKNTKIFEEVFNCIPCDSATTFSALKRIREQSSLANIFPEKAKELLKGLQGRLVSYPLSFLQDEALKPGPAYKESLLPVEVWT